MRKFWIICCLIAGFATAGLAQAAHPAVTDPEQKAKGLQKQLKLTDAQTVKVASVYKESAEKFEKIKADEHGNTNKMTVAIAPLRKATIKKIKSILTPEQKTKYDALIKDSKNTSGASGWSDGWSAAS